MCVRAIKIKVVGIVQGVGFRPFVYRLANELKLKGYVVNLGGSEVEIHLEGSSSDIEEFIDRLYREKPPHAKIVNMYIEEVVPQGYREFVIGESRSNPEIRSMIPPDIAICSNCMEEILDSRSRFYRYPWNSCAWCGPRFSMMFNLPYDRVNTSMNSFKMCEKCLKSYRDPADVRRFHGQGISCPVCGPRTYIYTPSRERIDVDDPVLFIAKKILEGAIVAIKGVGGYHIACLASRDDVVAELRSRKKRLYKPFALMARDIAVVEKIAIVDQKAIELLQSPQRPIVILPKKEPSPVSELVAPGLSTIGIMLPYTGLQILLLNEIPDGFLVMTSGNIHGEPMCVDLECVLDKLRDVVDYVVEHERAIVHRVDDSVIRFTDGEPVFLRRGRGYAPEWIEVTIIIPDSVAVGADLQTAGAIGFENKVILTQFIGDVDDPTALYDLEKELLWFVKNYRIEPKAIAMDMHPQYYSRRVAKELSDMFGVPTIEVQHHHAHIVSVLGEYGVHPEDNVVGIAIDGTGYGTDGGIWGGEILITNYSNFKRVGSLKPFTLPGGDTAAIYTVKPLVALMASSGLRYEEIVDIVKKLDLASALPYGFKELELMYVMSRGGRGVVTTSMGRTLDAFSALLKICIKRTYEGEPPMRLEALADRGSRYLGYEPRITLYNNLYIVDTGDLLLWVLENMDRYRREDIAITILRGLGKGLGMIALNALKGLRNTQQLVALGGGAAVNTYIVQGVKEVLREEDVAVVLPKKVPPGDGGIALGQILVASFRLVSYG
ncbi:MAG: carbamoyltransferase HypF [Ignisphaera sp.]